MWIRSQDKNRLIKCTNIHIEKDDNNSYFMSYNIFNDDNLLGKYSTEEKALKVLDKIENEIGYYEKFYGNNHSYCVFKMPQDNEV